MEIAKVKYYMGKIFKNILETAKQHLKIALLPESISNSVK